MRVDVKNKISLIICIPPQIFILLLLVLKGGKNSPNHFKDNELGHLNIELNNAKVTLIGLFKLCNSRREILIILKGKVKDLLRNYFKTNKCQIRKKNIFLTYTYLSLLISIFIAQLLLVLL